MFPEFVFHPIVSIVYYCKFRHIFGQCDCVSVFFVEHNIVSILPVCDDASIPNVPFNNLTYSYSVSLCVRYSYNIYTIFFSLLQTSNQTVPSSWKTNNINILIERKSNGKKLKLLLNDKNNIFLYKL